MHGYGEEPGNEANVRFKVQSPMARATRNSRPAGILNLCRILAGSRDGSFACRLGSECLPPQ